jgi:hypothetical protein
MPQIRQHRIRLNQEYRNKIAIKIDDRLQMEDTIEKDRYTQLREQMKPLQDKTWELMYSIGRENYPQKDVDMANYLQNKYENVNTIAPDSCFHVAYQGVHEEDVTNYNGQVTEKKGSPKMIEEHFDFKVNGSVDTGSTSRSQDSDFGYAYFRDEMKGKEGLNPDINILMKDKDSNNPYQRKIQEANDKFLGMNCEGRDNATSYQKEWDKNYSMDLIGREYCRDRQLMTSKENYDQLIFWKTQKSAFIMAHENWIKSIMTQMKEVKLGLKGYRYLDEAIELCTELGLNITDAEIIRTNSTGLTIFNPKNLAERIKGMKNVKKMTTQEKILARVEYERQAQSGVVN